MFENLTGWLRKCLLICFGFLLCSQCSKSYKSGVCRVILVPWYKYTYRYIFKKCFPSTLCTIFEWDGHWFWFYSNTGTSPCSSAGAKHIRKLIWKCCYLEIDLIESMYIVVGCFTQEPFSFDWASHSHGAGGNVFSWTTGSGSWQGDM